MNIFSKGTLSTFDWFLISGVVFFNILHSTLVNELDVIGSLASVSGVICVVLAAKRSMSNYLFGVINVSLYAYISYEAGIYGDFFLNAFYYLPMQFIGWFMWMKNRGGYDSKGKLDFTLVKTKSMSLRNRVLLGLFCLIAVLLIGALLQQYTSDTHPYKDSFTTVLSIVAMFLMVRKYMEQWFLWCMVNIVSIIMWAYVWYAGDIHAALMVIMWVFYLANSINGLRIWSISSSQEQVSE